MRKFFTFLLCLVLMTPFTMKADEIIIGTGTNQETTVPFCTNYRYSWNETIYSGSEIGDACTINAISFSCNSGEGIGTLTLSELDVYMGITQRDQVASVQDWTPMSELTLVYSGTNVVIGDAEWETITLDSPYYFPGEGNLVIVTAKKTSGYNGKLKWYYTPVEKSTLYRCNDSSEEIADNHPGSNQANHVVSYRANLKLDVTPGALVSPLVLTPDTIDFGYRPVGAWMRPVSIEASTTGETVNITSIASTNPFFVYTPVEMPYVLTPENPFTVNVSHLSAEGEVEGKIIFSHDFGSNTVEMSAIAYEPDEADVWEMARVVNSYPFVETPDFDRLHDNYLLPGEEQDGPDAVYRLALQEETQLSAKVYGENGKVALYAANFNGKGGPHYNNYYGAPIDPEDEDGPDPFPEVQGNSFFYDFNDGSLEDWRTIDADGDLLNWSISSGGILGMDSTKCIYSYSFSPQLNGAITPDNYIVTRGLYTITENSTLSFYAKPLDPNYHAEHYAVVVSTDGINFETIWGHTVSLSELDWTLKTVDLSAYAGRNVYVGLRHYNVSGKYAICIDNIELNPGREMAKADNMQNFTVPAGIYYLVASATEEFTVSIITETENGNNTVSEVVAEVVNDNSAKAYWSWDFINSRLAFDSGRAIENEKNNKGFSNYKLYRRNIFTEAEAVLVAGNVTDTVYVDNTWAEAENGIYQYGVSVVYGNTETAVVWSNAIEKDMNVDFTLNVVAENGASVAGTEVSFVKVDDPSYKYETTLDETGSYTWNDFRLGTYNYTLTLEGFKVYSATIVITTAMELDCTLEEIFVLGDLYVSPTGWAMWEDDAESFEIYLDDALVAEVTGNRYQFDVTNLVEGQRYTTKVVGENELEYSWNYIPSENFVTVSEYNAEVNGKNVELEWTLPIQGDGSYPSEFMFDFEDGTLNGFITIDANADGRTWTNSTAVSQTETGYESANSAVSRSYDGLYDFEPDDYLVTASKYAITEDSKLTFYVCAENHLYPAEHYGVAISEFSNVSPMSFEVIWEETLSSKGEGKVERNERAQGTWYRRVVDLSDYAGKDVYIAIRHFNCFGQFWINIDDLALVCDSKATAEDEDGEWIHYDTDEHLDAVGMTNGSTLKWGIMFPAEDLVPYAGQVMTKVSIYDNEAHEGNISIYFGGTSFPANLIHTQPYTCTGAKDYVEFELTRVIDITGTDNIWVTFANKDGKFVASCCAGTGDPNGGWISLNGTDWTNVEDVVNVDLTWQMRAYVEAPKEPNYTELEVLGAMVYRNGELLTEEPITEETYIDVNPGYGDFEYSVRAVFGGDDNSYYAMSSPQTAEVSIVRTCDAPRNLHGAESVNEEGNAGVALVWPYTLQGSEWLYYDNGTFNTGIGNGSSIYWGIKFPYESLEYYGGTMITKVSVFDNEPHTGNLLVYYGGDNAPEILAHTQPYELNGTGKFVELELLSPLPVDPSMNLWIVLNNNEGTYPASACSSTGDPNGRWISLDGTTWMDVVDAAPGLNYTWMIRIFVTNEFKEVVEIPQESLEYENNATGEGVLMTGNADTRESTFEHYNVYRGTSNDDYELIAETTEGNYFDEVEPGSYYYKVTSVYTVDGEECESEGANAFGNENQRFVIVEVTSINENNVSGLMIYPNPAKDNLTIMAENMTRITVTNTLGQVVLDKSVNSDNEEINMSQYESGIYMVRIATENGVAMKKVTVIK